MARLFDTNLSTVNILTVSPSVPATPDLDPLFESGATETAEPQARPAQTELPGTGRGFFNAAGSRHDGAIGKDRADRQKRGMRRADRLFDLILILRDGRLHRAEDLARRLGVSLRTIYRDMDTLIASGVPIAGERGLGYLATAAITLPPLNLTTAELEALQRGLAAVTATGDQDLRTAALSLAAKIEAVLPQDGVSLPENLGLAVPPFAAAARGFQHMPAIRAAIRARQKLRLIYRDTADEVTDRTIRPLELAYWGRLWTATAWCELSAGFRTFRVDRIERLTVLPQLFVDEPGRTLADYRATGS